MMLLACPVIRSNEDCNITDTKKASNVKKNQRFPTRANKMVVERRFEKKEKEIRHKREAARTRHIGRHIESSVCRMSDTREEGAR